MDIERLRALASQAGYRLVKGKGNVVGKHDYGRYGLENAKTGHKAFGFGNRGVTAQPEEVARFLEGDAGFDASLKAGKKRK
jgi:hypothetical protein